MTRARHWQDLVAVEDLEPGDATPVKLGARELAVYDTVDGIFVSFARCTHGNANLCDGYFDGLHIECPLHQGLFDARTGEAKAAPATRGLRMVEARVRDGTVQVLLAGDSKGAQT
ncbi:MAG: non-heme iron oxygenase ferredoxin subunit [Albidovulum sp.]|nr:non-heme iron oxygenase ferredoxin subunit [Albidovulum sp.]